MPFRVIDLNPVGRVVSQRRVDLSLPRNVLPHPNRIQYVEVTAKTWRALHLLELEGSEKILQALGLELDELRQVADGEMDPNLLLEKARERVPLAAVEEA
ncbi:MAG: hypothetical protein MI919_34625 [Holophagales bacterium]|nr:hypothetical protein [Holophagales bacterium]